MRECRAPGARDDVEHPAQEAPPPRAWVGTQQGPLQKAGATQSHCRAYGARDVWSTRHRKVLPQGAWVGTQQGPLQKAGATQSFIPRPYGLG